MYIFCASYFMLRKVRNPINISFYTICWLIHASWWGQHLLSFKFSFLFKNCPNPTPGGRSHVVATDSLASALFSWSQTCNKSNKHLNPILCIVDQHFHFISAISSKICGVSWLKLVKPQSASHTCGRAKKDVKKMETRDRRSVGCTSFAAAPSKLNQDTFLTFSKTPCILESVICYEDFHEHIECLEKLKTQIKHKETVEIFT